MKVIRKVIQTSCNDVKIDFKISIYVYGLNKIEKKNYMQLFHSLDVLKTYSMKLVAL